MEELSAVVGALEESGNPLFVDLARSEFSFLRMRLESMVAGRYEILGHREELINSLLRYLGVLSRGDDYMTVTVPSFWSERNLGLHGRFLTMNMMMALRGVVVQRVFLLCDGDADDAQVCTVLRAHLDAAKELEQEGVATRKAATPEASLAEGRVYYAGYVMVSEEERKLKVERGDHVAIWTQRNTNNTMAISFSSRPDTHEIGKVRFSASPRLREVLAEFERTISESRPLEEFFGKPASR